MSINIKKKLLWIVISICLVLLFICSLIFRFILTNIWNFLVVNEAPKPSDVIIVLSGDTGRVEYGVKLYQMGNAKKLLLTGSGSRSMKRQAMSLGVMEDHILIENKSHTTFENARNSLKIIQSQGYKSAILVTSAYHTKRASIIFARFFQGVELTICSVPYDSSIPDNWWKDKHTAKAVITEYMKIIWHYLFER